MFKCLLREVQYEVTVAILEDVIARNAFSVRPIHSRRSRVMLKWVALVAPRFHLSAHGQRPLSSIGPAIAPPNSPAKVIRTTCLSDQGIERRIQELQ